MLSPQELNDHGALISIGSVGDAYDNAMAESFVDIWMVKRDGFEFWGVEGQNGFQASPPTDSGP